MTTSKRRTTLLLPSIIRPLRKPWAGIPHPDFTKGQASRPDWNHGNSWHLTKTVDPDRKLGRGANDGGESLKKEHVEIDAYEDGRPAVFNYKLVISAIIPRPIGFVSSRSEDGALPSCVKLFPKIIRLILSLVRHLHRSCSSLLYIAYRLSIMTDRPLFTIGFAGGFSNAKDTLTDLSATKERTINIISEHFLEAANATSINAPFDISEWALSGLTAAPCTNVACPRVKEAVFSVEGKLFSTHEFESRAVPGKKTSVLAVVEKGL